MSIRYSNASSLISFVVLLSLCLAFPVRAQTSIDTEKVEDAIRLLRIAALSLKRDPDRGRAFTGLVQAQLERKRLKAAQIELKNIRDRLWRVRSQIYLADYHLRKGRTKTARRTLANAVKSVGTKTRRAGADDTFEDIAIRQADMGDFEPALATARRISVPLEKLDLILRIADQKARSRDKKIAASAVKTFDEAFGLAKKLTVEPVETADVLLRIAGAQVDAKQDKRSLRTLEYLRNFLLQNEFEGRDDRIARLAGAYVLAGDNNTAMSIVRTIRNVGNRVQAMSAVAGAIGKLGNIDAAVPLFSLAFQDSERIETTDRRYEIIEHLVREQALVGRYADAFKMAGYIRDRRKQASTMLVMGKAMLEKEDHANAERLTDYIPYIGMRSQIFTNIALMRGISGDKIEATALLAKGLTDTPLKKTFPASLEQALMNTIDVQNRVGAPEAAESLFRRVSTLSKLLPEMEPQVAILSQIAYALSKIGKLQEARDVLDVAWRLTWRDTKHPDFAEMLSHITEAQLAAGFVLQAFDTAARIPDQLADASEEGEENVDAMLPFESPRNRALHKVAVAAGRQGQPKLSIRAVRAISNETARAFAVAQIAVAVAKAER